MYPPCTQVYPGVRCTLRLGVSVMAGSVRQRRPAMGLSSANSWCCNGLIQRATPTCLYSEYRLALHSVNRLGCSSSLGRYIRKIGHGNFRLPCFAVCELTHGSAPMYVLKLPRMGKIMFQLLAENILRLKGYTALNWPELMRLARIDMSGHGQTRECPWRGTSQLTVRQPP